MKTKLLYSSLKFICFKKYGSKGFGLYLINCYKFFEFFFFTGANGMNSLFVVTKVQVNDYLPEYPKGAQGSVVGVYASAEKARVAMQRAVQADLQCWNCGDDEDEDLKGPTAFIDTEESSEDMVLLWALDGDVCHIYQIVEKEITD